MERPSTAGPRQTCERVFHPKRGPCWAVYSNGPSFIQPDGGEPIHARVSFGGASSEPSRSWLVVDDPNHGRVEMDRPERADRVPYEKHERLWHPRMGLGWFVDICGTGPISEDSSRFEPDDGEATAFRWIEICVGRPEYREKLKRAHRRSPAHSPEEMKWRTYVLDSGEVLTFRKDGPPGPDVDDEIEKPKKKTVAAKQSRSPEVLARRLEEIRRHNEAAE